MQFSLQGLHASAWSAVCLAAVVAAGGIIVLLLRYERALVTRGVGRALLLLRLAVLAVLFLALCRPVVTWTRTHERSGRIVVGIDVSDSMRQRDPHAAVAEKLRWARAVQLIGDASIDADLEQRPTDREAGRAAGSEQGAGPPPGEVAEGSRVGDPRGHVRRELLQEVFSEVDQWSRAEIARRLLLGPSRALLPALERIGALNVVLFAGAAEPADPHTLSTLLLDPPAALRAGETNLERMLAGAGAGDGDQKLLGIVLFTDGRHTATGDPASAAERLGAAAIPVFPVMLGSEQPSKDLGIETLDYPHLVFRDDDVLLKATLITSRVEGQAVEVVVHRGGDELQRQTIVPTGLRTNVEFALKPPGVGRHEYTLQIGAPRSGEGGSGALSSGTVELPVPLADETRSDNNARALAVTVVDDRARVLVLEGEARWEFRFLDNALSRDARVEIRSVVFRQPYTGALPDTFFPRRLDWPPTAEAATSPLDEYDLVVIGDIAPGDLPGIAWNLLERFVSDTGGTLICSAGKNHFPLAFNSAVLDRLLPVTDPVTVQSLSADAADGPGERGFRLQLTESGAAATMLQLDPDAGQSRRIWSELPGHPRGILAHPKPAAIVLAEAVWPAGHPPPQAADRRAVLVQQHYGLGQVLWLGIDSTWRWRHRTGDLHHHRFWGQLARWAAENKAAVSNEFVRFGPESADIQTGQSVVIRAQWARQVVEKWPGLRAWAALFRREDSGEVPMLRLALKPQTDRASVYAAEVPALPPGSYRVRLHVEGAELGSEPIEASLHVADPYSRESADSTANRALLTQLAQASGGRLLLPDELDLLPALLRPEAAVSELTEEVELWNHWLTLLLFFALLTAEWFTRKLHGLP